MKLCGIVDEETYLWTLAAQSLSMNNEHEAAAYAMRRARRSNLMSRTLEPDTEAPTDYPAVAQMVA